MSLRAGTVRIDDVGRTMRAAALSPFRPQTYLNLLYLLLAFPLGVIYFVFLVTGFSLGFSLLILLIGAPILLLVLAISHVFAAFERATTRHLLSVEIDSPGYPFLEGEDELDGVRVLVFGLETYAAVCYLFLKFVIGIVSFVLVTTMLTTSVVLLLTPLYYDQPNVQVGLVNRGEPIHLTPSLQLPWNELLVGIEFAVTIAEWEATTLPGALAVSAVGVVVLIASLALLNAFAWLNGQFSRVFLGTASRDALEYVRQRTAD
ncbi:sensor domain-containing protein [Natronorubrum sp. FCH18a]|uniref:sensor domain-containing protein n=1 Tax=Natronorubrum sp. FCH18a TaxID=3447018 RepID=UPI003F515D0A